MNVPFRVAVWALTALFLAFPLHAASLSGTKSVGPTGDYASLTVTIHEVPVDPFAAVDSKLIQLAKMLSARLLSNDGNLCSIARLQGITALNLNDLNKALRPVVAAGDEITLTLTKEGREPHQAVGYLPDGTMIVVNNSRSQVGKSVRVSISSVRQTSAGRLFFAELAA